MHCNGYRVALWDYITYISNYVALEMETITLLFFTNFLPMFQKVYPAPTS